MSVNLPYTAAYKVSVHYSNAHEMSRPLESVAISIDGMPVGSFTAQNTGSGGHGWNMFLSNGVGSSIVHTPLEALEALWNDARWEDLNQDGVPELLHPRFGLADAFN